MYSFATVKKVSAVKGQYYVAATKKPLTALTFVAVAKEYTCSCPAHWQRQSSTVSTFGGLRQWRLRHSLDPFRATAALADVFHGKPEKKNFPSKMKWTVKRCVYHRNMNF